jgi:hypothetical protein
MAQTLFGRMLHATSSPQRTHDRGDDQALCSQYYPVFKEKLSQTCVLTAMVFDGIGIRDPKVFGTRRDSCGAVAFVVPLS